MGNEITTEAVRLALGMHELQARVASMNIASSSRPNAQAMRVDLSDARATLAGIGGLPGNSGDVVQRLQSTSDRLRAVAPRAAGEGVQNDEEVATLVAASTSYQALGEALSRQFALMRLAVTGRS